MIINYLLVKYLHNVIVPHLTAKSGMSCGLLAICSWIWEEGGNKHVLCFSGELSNLKIESKVVYR